MSSQMLETIKESIKEKQAEFDAIRKQFNEVQQQYNSYSQYLEIAKQNVAGYQETYNSCHAFIQDVNQCKSRIENAKKTISEARQYLDSNLENLKIKSSEDKYGYITTDNIAQKTEAACQLLFKFEKIADQLKKERDSLMQENVKLENDRHAFLQDIEPIRSQTEQDTKRTRSTNRGLRNKITATEIRQFTDQLNSTAEILSQHTMTSAYECSSAISSAEALYNEATTTSLNLQKRLYSDDPPSEKEVLPHVEHMKTLLTVPDDHSQLLAESQSIARDLLEDRDLLVDELTQIIEDEKKLRDCDSRATQLTDHLLTANDILTFDSRSISNVNKRLMAQNLNAETQNAALAEETKKLREYIEQRKSELQAKKTLGSLTPADIEKKAHERDQLKAENDAMLLQLNSIRKDRETNSLLIIDLMTKFKQLRQGDTVINSADTKMRELHQQIIDQYLQSDFTISHLSTLQEQLTFARRYAEDSSINQETPIENVSLIKLIEPHGLQLDYMNKRMFVITQGSPASLSDALFHPANIDPEFNPTLVLILLRTNPETIRNHLLSARNFMVDVFSDNHTLHYGQRADDFIVGHYPIPGFPDISSDFALQRFSRYILSWLQIDAQALLNSGVISDLIDFFSQKSNNPVASKTLEILSECRARGKGPVRPDYKFKPKDIKTTKISQLIETVWADHLHAIEFNLYRQITGTDIINYLLYGLGPSCQSIENFVRHFNNLVSLIKSETIAALSNVKDAETEIKVTTSSKWGTILTRAKEAKNFFLVHAIVTAFSDIPGTQQILDKQRDAEDTTFETILSDAFIDGQVFMIPDPDLFTQKIGEMLTGMKKTTGNYLPSPPSVGTGDVIQLEKYHTLAHCVIHLLAAQDSKTDIEISQQVLQSLTTLIENAK